MRNRKGTRENSGRPKDYPMDALPSCSVANGVWLGARTSATSENSFTFKDAWMFYKRGIELPSKSAKSQSGP